MHAKSLSQRLNVDLATRDLLILKLSVYILNHDAITTSQEGGGGGWNYVEFKQKLILIVAKYKKNKTGLRKGFDFNSLKSVDFKWIPVALYKICFR